MRRLKRSDFQRYNLGRPAPRCPLCINNANAKEHVMERHYVEARHLIVFKCDRYQVAIRVDDPFVGRWEQALANVGHAEGGTPGAILCPVPTCQTPMRFFATSVGYMKAACPKKGCGATTAAGEVGRTPLQRSLPEAAESGEGTPGVDKVYTPENPGRVQ